jgi:hypothetical protein
MSSHKPRIYHQHFHCLPPGIFLSSLFISFLLFLTVTLGIGYYQFNCPVFSGCPISTNSQVLISSYFLWNFGIVILPCLLSCFVWFPHWILCRFAGCLLLVAVVQHWLALLCVAEFRMHCDFKFCICPIFLCRRPCKQQRQHLWQLFVDYDIRSKRVAVCCHFTGIQIYITVIIPVQY